MDWDNLAYEIMMLDSCLGNKKLKIKKNVAKFMNIKLEALEYEKNRRVIKGFSYDRYLGNMGTQDGLPVEEDNEFSDS